MSQKYRDRQKQLIDSVRADVSAVRAKASVVPIQADYAADGGRCLTSVLFVPTLTAAFLQTNIQQTLARAEPFHYYQSARIDAYHHQEYTGDSKSAVF